MDEAQSPSGETRPADPDLHWTGWALDRLREVVDLDIRTKRMTVREQERILRGAEMPDFPLMQSRLSRSVRLSILMIERVRTDYLMRKQERIASGAQARRRQKREEAAEAVARAAAQPGDAEDLERVRSEAREALDEDEILDAQIDTLSPQEFVRAVCRRIGRPPDPSWLPPGWCDDEAKADDTQPVEPAEPAEGWPRPMDEAVAGRVMPRPPESDSS